MFDNKSDSAAHANNGDGRLNFLSRLQTYS